MFSLIFNHLNYVLSEIDDIEQFEGGLIWTAFEHFFFIYAKYSIFKICNYELIIFNGEI